MIDRRFFLKCLVGMGVGLSPLPCFGAKKEQITQEEAFANFMLPYVTLIVKVNEVELYQKTGEFDAIGECFISGRKTPVTVRFFLAYTDLQSIQPGVIYIMTGELFFYEDATGMDMVSPECTPAKAALSGHFLSEAEQRFLAKR